MSTVGWFLILAALLIVRQVAHGRVLNLGEDISDMFTALVTGNTAEFTAVLARTGDSATSTVAASSTAATGAVGAAPASLLAAAMKRGKAAKGYVFGATGPTYYDCSGLVWRACQDCGYTGNRFTTFTIQSHSEFSRTDSPQVNDIVLWPTHHMGVMSGAGTFYSARNPKAGITDAKIDSFRKEPPVYLRFGTNKSDPTKLQHGL